MPNQPPIDWDLVGYSYDPDTGKIEVFNFTKRPLLLAHVPLRNDPTVASFVHRLVNAANERLAQDRLAREALTKEEKK